MADVELTIQNRTTVYYPAVEDGIVWETERKGSPGRLSFSVIKDSAISFVEGNAVRLKVDGRNVFFGFIFQKKRDKNDQIQVVAYDQLRYFKNKDTYIYRNKRADELVKMIASDFNMQFGELENTGFKIESRIEDNKTLFDMVQTALDLTLQSIKKMYVLYDDFGKLALKDVSSLRLDLLIDEETGENFNYTSSIDGKTFNKIKLTYDNEETGRREVYIAKDTNNINNWGVLQYYEGLNDKVNGRTKADALLQMYNRKTRNLTITKAFGDPRVRAGFAVAVQLNLGDVVAKNYMMVEKAKHIFNNGEHWMDLTLRGGEFIA